VNSPPIPPRTPPESLVSNAEKNIELLKKLEQVGLSLVPAVQAKSSKLRGKTFVVTGTLPTLSRDQLKQMIRENGGKIQSSVSAKTMYLVAGENPGSKYEKAQKLKIPILSEGEFSKMLE
jgi:DNA ligase (NAD+)